MIIIGVKIVINHATVIINYEKRLIPLTNVGANRI